MKVMSAASLAVLVMTAAACSTPQHEDDGSAGGDARAGGRGEPV